MYAATAAETSGRPQSSYFGMKPRRRRIVSALTGGIAGSFLMDVAQYTWALGFERGRPSNDQDEETEAITAVVEILTDLAPRLFRKANAAPTGRAIHYLFGVAFAAAYLSVFEDRRPAVVRGAVFGTLLWLLSDRILIPVFKLGRPWSRYSIAERTNALVSHLVYAIVVEFSRRPQ
jgi:hypothetical protein